MAMKAVQHKTEGRGELFSSLPERDDRPQNRSRTPRRRSGVFEGSVSISSRKSGLAVQD